MSNQNAKKNALEVIINGKHYSLTGSESPEYLQKLSAYLNAKYSALKEMPAYRTMDIETRGVLLQINICDDYFKAQEQLIEMTDETEDRDEEIFNLKHDILELRRVLEEKNKQIEQLQQENVAEQKKVVKLETELSGYKKRKNN